MRRTLRASRRCYAALTMKGVEKILWKLHSCEIDDARSLSSLLSILCLIRVIPSPRIEGTGLKMRGKIFNSHKPSAAKLFIRHGFLRFVRNDDCTLRLVLSPARLHCAGARKSIGGVRGRSVTPGIKSGVRFGAKLFGLFWVPSATPIILRKMPGAMAERGSTRRTGALTFPVIR